MSAPDVLDLVLGKLDGVRPQPGGRYMARCPAHDDSTASLSVGRGTEQPVVLHCYAECDTEDILAKIGLTTADISRPAEDRQPDGEWTPRGPAVAVYSYTDENGKLLYQVCRTADKQFPQRRPDPSAKSGWRWNLNGVTRVPYHLPQLLAAVKDGKAVWCAEGEKDVHALEAAGVTATCNSEGAGKWKPEFAAFLPGVDVTIVADKDGPEKKYAGQKHAAAVAASLRGRAKSVRVVAAAQGKDAADHLAAGYGLDDFVPADLSVLSAAKSATAATAVPWDGDLAAGHSLTEFTDADLSVITGSPQAPSGTAGAGALRVSDVKLPDMAAFTDSELARQAIADVLNGRFLFADGLDWVAWDGKRWKPGAGADARYAVNLYLRNVFADRVQSGTAHRQLTDLLAILSKGKIKAVTDLAADNPAVRKDAGEFDADPDLLNTPDGIVNLRTGKRIDHDPKYLMTKITRGRYRPGYEHPDWTKALGALPAAERTWYQTRIGQGITGYQTPDGVMPVLQGSGENGKTALTTDGLVPALGDYADVASPKLVATDRPGRSEHSTERADLRGQRLLIGEELSEGRSLDITALKRIMDVSHIKARKVHKDNITFEATHSLFVTTNYVPVVTETDHGTWRRLALLKFPYTFRKTAEECVRAVDRLGDPTLKHRIKKGAEGQHDAIVTWAVEGAKQWYANPDTSLLPTKRIAADTLQWRITADRILGFWTDKLIADDGPRVDPPPCIWAEEMTEAFNLWLKANGHEAWSRETFAPRFAEHQETTRHGVESKRTRKLGSLSRRPTVGPFDTVKAPPKIASVWTRVRFRTSADQPKDSECAESAESLPNISMPICDEKIGSDSAPSAHPLSEEPPDAAETALQGARLAPVTDLRNVTDPSLSRQLIARTCPDCGQPEDSMFHAMCCLGQDPAA